MVTLKLTERLRQCWEAKFPRSAELARRANAVFPNGVTHDNRHLDPFPLFIDRAHGACKTTVDGHTVIDYAMGHGALLLGHHHSDVVAAVQRQADRGTHFSACHELELEWAAAVQQLVPSAELVRFTSSGTEATQLALRVARVATGRPRIIKFAGHFHGWHDGLVPGAYAPYTPESFAVVGIPTENAANLTVLPPNDLEALQAALARRDVAAVILEPTGGHWGTVPTNAEFLRALRTATADAGTLLIFDEVITGFRVHAGGAQALYDVLPDLTCLAKILAGGLPGGALAGRGSVMEVLAFNNPRGVKIRHPGTFNGNPLSAAAGLAALKVVAQTQPAATVNRYTAELIAALNELFVRRSVDWLAYGTFSMIHILPHYHGEHRYENLAWPLGGDYLRLDPGHAATETHAFRAALLLGGVDWFGWGGMTSITHGPAEFARTIDAFDQAIDLLSE